MADKLPSASQQDAEKQQKDSAWPKPGDEGFVYPDGTPTSVTQLEDNKQAQADRDHIAAVMHGAPLATPGPQAQDITAEKVANAAAKDVPDSGPASWVEENLPSAQSSGSKKK